MLKKYITTLIYFMWKLLLLWLLQEMHKIWIFIMTSDTNLLSTTIKFYILIGSYEVLIRIKKNTNNLLYYLTLVIIYYYFFAKM